MDRIHEVTDLKGSFYSFIIHRTECK